MSTTNYIAVHTDVHIHSSTCVWYSGSDVFLEHTQHTELQDNWRHTVDCQAVWWCTVCACSL